MMGAHNMSVQIVPRLTNDPRTAVNAATQLPERSVYNPVLRPARSRKLPASAQRTSSIPERAGTAAQRSRREEAAQKATWNPRGGPRPSVRALPMLVELW